MNLVKYLKVTSILNKHKKRDEWFLDDYTINPYEACSFNCLYCYIRGSKYGENMERGLIVKINAPQLLEKQLSKYARKKEYGFIALSSATDPYIPIEKEVRLTRKLLQIILHYRFPVIIITKSPLILRDLDLLEEIDTHAILPDDLKEYPGRGTMISFSFSTLDPQIAKIFEPKAPTPQQRIDALKECKKEGFFCGINFIPLLPYLSDSHAHIEEMVRLAQKLKVDFTFFGALTLFGNQKRDSKVLYFKALKQHFPDLLKKYQLMYASDSYPQKSYQEKITQTARSLCKKHHVSFQIAKNQG